MPNHKNRKKKKSKGKGAPLAAQGPSASTPSFSCRWLPYYIYGCLPVYALATVAYFAFLTLPALVLPAWEMGMQGMALLIAAASLSPAALAAYLVVPLARRRAAGFRGNRIFLAVAPLLPLYMPWQMLLLLAAFALPNLIYFERRKSLFAGPEMHQKLCGRLVAIPMLVGLTLCLVQFGLGPVGVYWIYAANIAALVLALWVRRRPPLLSDRDVYFDGEH